MEVITNGENNDDTNEQEEKLALHMSSTLEFPRSPTPLSKRDSMQDKFVEVEDKFCDPDKPVLVKMEDVVAAAFAIKGGISKIPCTVRKLSYLY